MELLLYTTMSYDLKVRFDNNYFILGPSNSGRGRGGATLSKQQIQQQMQKASQVFF